MSESKDTVNKVAWTCVKCSTPLQVSENVHYFQCRTCSTMFRLHWSNGKIERQTVLQNITQRIETGFSEEYLNTSASELQVRLRNLNDSIRNLEMAKGAERIRVLAVLLLITATIYLLFRVTVQGVNSLMEPGLYELVAAGVLAFSLFIIIVFRIYKAAMVSRVNKLIVDRDNLEAELQRVEATRDLQTDTEESVGQERDEIAEPDDNTTRDQDIIERFATRKKEGRKRLNLREDQE